VVRLNLRLSFVLVLRLYGEYLNFPLRFQAETLIIPNSSACSKRLWNSEFQAVPYDPIEAAELQRRRANRALCLCDPTARAQEDMSDPKIWSLAV
jgi:hypothetical protein